MKASTSASLQSRIAKRLQQAIFTCLAISFIAVTLYVLINSPA